MSITAGCARGGGGLWSYGLARFARIYPVTCLSMLLMIPFVPRSAGMIDYWQFLLLQSWIPLGLSDGSITSNWNMQAWTLSVELFFYLSFPLILWRFEVLGNRALAVILMLLAAIIVVTRLSEIREASHLVHPALLWVPMPVLKLPEFMYGMLLGVFHRRGLVPALVRHRRAVPVMLALCLGIIVSTSSFWVAPAAALAFGGLIFVIAQDHGDSAIGRWLRQPWMILLGQASFCIYILQLPVNVLIKAALDPVSPLLARLAYIPAMIVLSIAIYRSFEEPMREWIRERFSPRVTPAS